MKLNNKQIEVQSTVDLDKVLDHIFQPDDHPDVIIESGPYLGTGTTKILAKAVERTLHSIIHIAIEANFDAYMECVKNIQHYPWIDVIHGFSIDRGQALAFMYTDEALNDHEKFPDIYIDNLDNPILYYATEMSPVCTGVPDGDDGYQNILEDIAGYSHHKFFICLDSCGGIGWYEFQKVMEYFGNEKFYIMLDDTDHIKHFRSKAWIETHQKGWRKLYDDGRVIVAEFDPNEPFG